MSMNLNSYDNAFVMEILVSMLDEVESSTFVSVFGDGGSAEPVDTLSGDIPHLNQQYTLGADDARDEDLIAFDEAPDEDDAALNTTTFQIGGKYAKKNRVNRTTLRALANVTNEEDVIRILSRQVLENIITAYDLDMVSQILTDQTTNSTVSAQKAWSNQSSADPFKDFNNAVDQIGEPDIIWLGLDKARELARTDAFVADAINFNASNFERQQEQVAQELTGRYGVEDVIISADHYHNGQRQETLNKKQTYNGVVWVGNSDHVKPVELRDMRTTAVWTDNQETLNHYQSAQFFMTAAQAEDSQGVVITGT